MIFKRFQNTRKPGKMEDTTLQSRKFHKLSGKLLHVREQVLQKVWLAVRVGAWLCLLPVLLRIHPLPHLLHRLGKLSGEKRTNPLEIDLVAPVVIRICRLPLFRPPLFPRSCLLQSLALYHWLTRVGYPVEIHFGVQKAGEELQWHSWVTVCGKPVAERRPAEVFKLVYSHPSA